MFSAQSVIDAFGRYCPQVLEGARRALSAATTSGRHISLPEKEFGEVPSISFDKSILEKIDNLAVVELASRWSDLGSWQAVADLSEKDRDANTIVGDVIALNSNGNYLRTEGPFLAALGINNLAVIATGDSILVANVNQAQNVKNLVAEMAARGRTEHLIDKTVYRPWGHYRDLYQGLGFKVKLVYVKSGGSLSLQMHHYRCEHWVVVNGEAVVTRGKDVFTLRENESTFIPLNTVHRLENRSEDPLNLIEVQTGPILEESDIERFSDIYGRSTDSAAPS